MLKKNGENIYVVHRVKCMPSDNFNKAGFFRPFVEYKGTISQSDFQIKQNELEMEANALISRGAKVMLQSGFNLILFLNFYCFL